VTRPKYFTLILPLVCAALTSAATAKPATVQQTKMYQETLRPQFHFTARQWTEHLLNPQQRQEGWINDLNGLIYYDGEYHLFAQRWAKCWLHAVSRDMIHWQELQPAFWEESEGSGVQSGTCVIDYENTSGLAKDKKHPAMVAFWSRFDNHSQCLCYSLDHGRTWTRYEKNPIMEHPERDPKVFWYEPGKHWVMMMYGDGQYHILTSQNLLDWHDEHHPIPDSFECPDFFQLPIDGDRHHMKWVLIQGSGYYSIGTFDGVQFHEESKRAPCDVGPNFYATQTWANTSTGDGRRVQVAWMRGADFPDMPFNQEISFPCELTLRTTAQGLKLFRQPIKELATLHESHRSWSHLNLEPNRPLTLTESGDLYQIDADVELPAGATLTFDLRGTHVTLTANSLQSGGDPIHFNEPLKHVQILLDRGSVEVFLNHGELSYTKYALGNTEGIRVSSEGRTILHSVQLYRLKSIWKPN
jgi:sucrose-6-phosphate hydrolase SacC (GH32 family)